MNDIFNYDVFLSFASKDEEIVKPIWQQLSSSGLKVFWSNETLKRKIGASFFEVIQDSLVQSKDFVLLASGNSMESDWVKQEYQVFYNQFFLKNKTQRRFIILPINNFNIKQLPPFLQILQCAESAYQLINFLGGENIQKIKEENEKLNAEMLKLNQLLMTIKEENKLLKQQTALESKNRAPIILEKTETSIQDMLLT